MPQLHPVHCNHSQAQATAYLSLYLSLFRMILTSQKIFPHVCRVYNNGLFPLPVSSEFMSLLFPLMMRVFSIQHYQCAATSAFLQYMREQASVTQDFAAFNLPQ